MKTIFRVIALALALMMVCGLFAACAETPGNNEVTTESPQAASTTAPIQGEVTSEESFYEDDDLNATYDFNTTITIYMWSDYTMMEFNAEESGDIIDDAIFQRNNDVENRLGITLEFVEEPGSAKKMTPWMQRAENDWQADNEFDIYAGYSRCAPQMVLKGMNANLLEYEAFNVEKTWWPKALTTECTINDKLYFCSGDISTNLLWMMTGTFYNKELYEKYYGTEKSPMDMVEANEWTMEKLFSMAKDVYTDDGNSQKDEGDEYGYVFYDTNIDAFQTAAGITSLEKTEDGGLRISEAWTSQRCADVCDLVGSFVKSEGVLHSNSTSIRNIFYEERALFITDRTFIVAGKDTSETSKVEFSYGVVPQPKYDTEQESFLTNVGHPFTMYAVNSLTSDIEAAVTTLEAMGSANHRSVTPAVFEVAMKVRYNDDPQASRMYDILRENISFDAGRLFQDSMGKGTSTLFASTALSGNPSGLLSNIQKNKKVIENGIDTIMKFYGN